MEKFDSRRGFTLMEIMIIVTIVAILAMGILFILGRAPIFKSHDAVKKSDLNRIKIAMEDYYEDKQCYPSESELNAILSSCNSAPPAFFASYLTIVPCTPDTRQPYAGYVAPGANCPQSYAVYAELTNDTDPVIAESGCSAGCGPGGGYSYGVSSSNITPASILPPDQPFYYCQGNGSIDNCNMWNPAVDGIGHCPPGAAFTTNNCHPIYSCAAPAPTCNPVP